MKQVGVILDLDDTLIGTSSVYYKAVVEAMLYTIRAMSPYTIEPKLMLDTYYETSKEVLARQRAGETKDLFPVSKAKAMASTDFPAVLTESFAVWCTKAGYRPTKEDLKKIHDLGLIVLTHKYELLPNARALLNMLDRKPNTTLFMITRGHRDLQGPKLAKPEFDRFERRILMPYTHTKLDEFKKLQLEYDNITDWYVIGDDINVDINPALACRMRAVLVTKAACHHSKGEVLNIGDSLRYFTEVYDLAECIEFLRKAYAEDHEFEYAV